jgi:Tfp pilus assembly protein PilX
MRFIKRQQDGFVLLLTLMCALILSGVMVSTMFVSTKGQKVVKNFKESVQTLNAADAAIKQAKGALNTWLAAQQVPALGGSGSEVDFSAILAASNAAGELVISGNATDWGSMNLMGNTVVVTVSNPVTDDDAGSDTVDEDRIIRLEAEAVSPTRQRVRIQASVQAPSVENTAGGMPSITKAAMMCNDITGKKQKLKVKKDTIVSGYDHALPASFPSTTAGYNSVEDTDPTGGTPAAALINAVKQTVNIDGDALVYGVIGGLAVTGASAVETLASDPGCSDLFAFADQLSLLSDSLPNVNVITADTVDSTYLGTRENPTITILNGVTTVAKKKTTKSKVKLASGSQGAGILILQGETEAATTVLASGKNFYYEGLIIVYGDEGAKITFQKEEMIYGAALVLTGSDDSVKTERITYAKDGRFAYSSAALANSNLAYGRALGSEPISLASDARNNTITIGWHEEYGF